MEYMYRTTYNNIILFYFICLYLVVNAIAMHLGGVFFLPVFGLAELQY
jgi:hypothetical protein